MVKWCGRRGFEFSYEPGSVNLNNFVTGSSLLIFCFLKGMLINFHMSFRNEKWINCIDFVMRTLQHLEVIIIIIVPAFISFNASRNEPALKGK